MVWEQKVISRNKSGWVGIVWERLELEVGPYMTWQRAGSSFETHAKPSKAATSDSEVRTNHMDGCWGQDCRASGIFLRVDFLGRESKVLVPRGWARNPERVPTRDRLGWSWLGEDRLPPGRPDVHRQAVWKQRTCGHRPPSSCSGVIIWRQKCKFSGLTAALLNQKLWG